MKIYKVVKVNSVNRQLIKVRTKEKTCSDSVGVRTYTPKKYEQKQIQFKE